jgi:hypothetical protein
MNKNFNLSKKIKKSFYSQGDLIFVKDVKEFIRLLKEMGKTSFKELKTNDRKQSKWLVINIDKLDELAGKELTK